MPESKSRRLAVCAALIVALFALAALGSSGASAAPRDAKAKAASSSPRRVGAADVEGVDRQGDHAPAGSGARSDDLHSCPLSVSPEGWTAGRIVA
jgi:hypothetical protein